MTSTRSHLNNKKLYSYFLKLGAFGFGGPIALVGYMERDLVEKEKLITPQEFREGLVLSKMAPGPMASQLAMYLGWIRGGVLGATLTGICLLLPGFLLVLLLAYLYSHYGSLTWIQSWFYGVGPVVLAIVLLTGINLSRKMVAHDRVLIGLSIICFLLMVFKLLEEHWIFLGAGLLNLLFRSSRTGTKKYLFSVPVLAVPFFQFDLSKVWEIFFYFSKVGALVFGSGLVILPFIHDGVVLEHQWLTEQQFLDSFSIAMVTPGPVLISVAFMGYLTHGILGAVAATIGIFLPSYLMVLLIAPSFGKLKDMLGVQEFVNGVIAGAVGLILGGAILLIKSTVTDFYLAFLFMLFLGVMQLKKRPADPLLLLLGGFFGFCIKNYLL